MVINIASFCIFIKLMFCVLFNIHFQKWSNVTVEKKMMIIYSLVISLTVTLDHFWKCMLNGIRNVKFIKMRKLTMFITTVSVLFFIKLRWPKNNSPKASCHHLMMCHLNWDKIVNHSQHDFTNFSKTLVDGLGGVEADFLPLGRLELSQLS